MVLTANTGSFSNDFKNNWNQILNSALRAMRDLIFTESANALEAVEYDIMELETRIREDFGATVLEKFSQRSGNLW